jgi:hypothetical protein
MQYVIEHCLSFCLLTFRFVFHRITTSDYLFWYIHTVLTCDIEQIYHAWEGYLRKIPVERRTISRAERRLKFSLKTGIFRKYPSQT